MRIIHCADLHIDSKMNTHLSPEKAKQRKNELLQTFERMLDYAETNNVDAIIIAGDLFDSDRISARARNTVRSLIEEHDGLEFYYLRGNHDVDSAFVKQGELPDNLHLFSDVWTKYVIRDTNKRIVLHGVELTKENSDRIYSTLVLDSGDFNIVTLHGQDSEKKAKDKAEVIGIRDLRGRSIDYLALGHVHMYKMEQLDSRGTYCYPGCLEGRGFDECGEHGFVLLDIDEKTGEYSRQFIPIAYRKIYECEVDVSGLQNTREIENKIKDSLVEFSYAETSLVKMVLVGEVDVECEMDIEYLKSRFTDDFYFFKLVDKSSYRIDMESLAMDVSLKGEFIRTVNNEELSEEDKSNIIRIGLQLFDGEEI